MSWSIRYLSTILAALALTSWTSAASVDYKVRNAPGASTADTYLAIRNEIAKAAVEKRDVYSSNTTLERRWVDATLLKLGHKRTAGEIQARPIDVGGMVDITCTECYILGTARAHLNISVPNPDARILEVTSNVTSYVRNLTKDFKEYTIDYLVKYFARSNLEDPQWKDLELPTFNYTMDLEVPEIPECTLKFEFDDLELYMDMNAVLEAGATYELPLYRSQTLAGLYITQDLNLGAFFTVDLILNVEGEIDISSGFHIKMADGIAMEIALFGDAVSDIKMPGGQFKFLPVVVESGDMVFSCVLRLGMFAGFKLATPQLKIMDQVAVDMFMPDVSGGIEVGIFANVAEFITSITFTPEEECKRNVVQSYQLALGAKAGATVAIGNNSWGPVPETSVPVWYTEMASVCAGEKPSTPATATSGIITTAPEDRKRQDLITMTIIKDFIHTGVNCLDVGLINCPAGRQNTSQSTEKRTIVTAVPSGMSNIDFPTTVIDSVPSTITFGRNAETITPIAGSPTSWVPPTSTGKFKGLVGGVQDAADDAIEDVKDTFQKAKTNKPLIIGLSVGVGAPILLGMLAGLLVLYRRRQSDISARGAYANPDTAPMMVQTPGQTPITPGYPSPNLMSGYQDYKAVKGATVEEKEIKSPGGSSGGSLR